MIDAAEADVGQQSRRSPVGANHVYLLIARAADDDVADSFAVTVPDRPPAGAGQPALVPSIGIDDGDAPGKSAVSPECDPLSVRRPARRRRRRFHQQPYGAAISGPDVDVLGVAVRAGDRDPSPIRRQIGEPVTCATE